MMPNLIKGKHLIEVAAYRFRGSVHCYHGRCEYGGVYGHRTLELRVLHFDRQATGSKLRHWV